jgi:hypothetical protein
MKKLFTFVSLVTGITLSNIPTVPVQATHINDYDNCAHDLLKTGINQQSAALACSEALYPQEVGKCVLQIKQSKNISVTEALSACQRVRRPLELSLCVADINRQSSPKIALAVLDNCRRSLLPKTFAQCVVGLKRRTTLPVAQLMDTCIKAKDSLR